MARSASARSANTDADEPKQPPVAPGVPLTAIKNRTKRQQLDDAALEYRENRAIISTAEARNKELMELIIEPILEDLDSDKVLGDTWQSIRTSRTTKTIKPELLISQGVSLAVVKKATVVKTSTSYQIRERKQQEDGGEEVES